MALVLPNIVRVIPRGFKILSFRKSFVEHCHLLDDHPQDDAPYVTVSGVLPRLKVERLVGQAGDDLPRVPVLHLVALEGLDLRHLPYARGMLEEVFEGDVVPLRVLGEVLRDPVRDAQLPLLLKHQYTYGREGLVRSLSGRRCPFPRGCCIPCWRYRSFSRWSFRASIWRATTGMFFSFMIFVTNSSIFSGASSGLAAGQSAAKSRKGWW
jgi:hypothetical protein